ncbi:hypothetical protein IG631_10703 [Alternaria alternata]|nr:hypothetical protein IG631_10703 [Alternaria alternata]
MICSYYEPAQISFTCATCPLAILPLIATAWSHSARHLPNAKHWSDNKPTCSEPQVQNCAIGASYRKLAAPSTRFEGSSGTGGKLR